MSITHDIDVLTAKQTLTTDYGVGGIDKVSEHKQNETTRKQADIA